MVYFVERRWQGAWSKIGVIEIRAASEEEVEIVGTLDGLGGGAGKETVQ